MMTPDGREIFFAGAGILWGATTFAKGVHQWHREHTQRVRKLFPWSPRAGKSSLPGSMVLGFALILGCTAYIAFSLRDSLR